MISTLAKLRQRLSSEGSSFLRSSAILTIGFTFARLLGLGFTLLLGRVLAAEEFGYIQYSILLSNLLLIGTQPLMQHILAREIGAHHTDPTRLERIFSSALALIPILVLITLVVAIPLFLISGNLNIGVCIIFLGVTVFYIYYGMARGFEASVHLVAVFIASNLIQLLLIILVYFVLHVRSSMPALIIYGLSYLLPVLVVSWRYPLPVRFRRESVDGSTMRDLAQSSVPVWISHAAFALFAGADIFVLQRFFPNTPELGAYAFTRQLSLAFDFVPMSLQTLIMPRIARSGANRRRLLLTSLALAASANLVAGAIYLLAYEWFIRTFFSASYLVPAVTVILLVVVASLNGLYGIVTSALVGINRGAVETISRVLTGVVIYLSCWLLIPTMGITGAALAQLITTIGAIVTLPLLLSWRKALERRQSRHIDIDIDADITVPA